jgi:flagellar protein FlgJ
MRADVGASQFALDVAGLQRLQQGARENRPEATRAAAQQFEALFLHQMIKGMRDTIPKSDLTNSKQTEFYQSLLDQQWAQTMAERGIGLADHIVAQLEMQGVGSSNRVAAPSASVPSARDQDDAATLIAGIPRGVPRPLENAVPPNESQRLRSASQADGASSSGNPAGAERASEPQRFIDAWGGRAAGPLIGPLGGSSGGETATERVESGGLFASWNAPSEQRASQQRATAGPLIPGFGDEAEMSEASPRDIAEHVEAFLKPLASPAQAASRRTGVPAELILAQAALETGWGRHQIVTEEGRNSHNLFGIKAGSRWQGPTTEITTHEHFDGRRVRIQDRFRVYDSFEAAFTDYASLISNSPRYSAVTEAPNAAQAARELQAGGYATDPAYADKLITIMESLGPVVSQTVRSPIFFSY